MKRYFCTFLAIITIMLGSSCFRAIDKQGYVYLAEEPGAVWYMDAKNLSTRQYDDGTYLDVTVYTYRIEDGFEYLEKNLWHMDVQNDRYKISATSSYDCEGNELGT